MPLTGGNLCYPPLSEGYFRYVKPGNPAAGTPLTWQHSTHAEAFELITSYVSLATSVVVANRYFRMRIFSSSGAIVWMGQSGLVQAASQSRAYSWDRKNGNINTFHWSSVHSGAIPHALILPGGSITIDVENMDAGDTLYSCLLQVRSHRII